MIKKNIITKLTGGFIFIVIISTLIVGIIALSIFKNNLFKIKERNITMHAKELGKILEPYLESHTDANEYKDILKFVNNIDNSKTWIINSKGEIRTFKDNRETIIEKNSEFNIAFSHIIKSSFQGNVNNIQQFNPFYGENMMTVSLPIIDNKNRIIGVILVHSSTSELSNSMNKFFRYLLVALLGEVIIAGLLGFYFSRNIAKPIKIINGAALEMTQGNYKVKTSLIQKDEIGELSNSFDLLGAKLQNNMEELNLEKNKLSDIIVSMKEGLIAIDKNSKIININNAALELLDLDDLEIKERIKDSLKVNTKMDLIFNYRDKTLNFSISPVLNKYKENTGVVIIIQDISQKEKLESMRKDFVANVSHEFRTPLTIIRGNLEALYDKVIKEDEIPGNYLTLLRETKRLEVMVKDLLDLSGLEAGKVKVNFEYLDVATLLEDILRVIKPITKEKNIKIQLTIDDNIPPLWSDYDKLKQLLLIFIDNSIKFSDNESIILLDVKFKDIISISITDFGIGIRSEDIPHLGERFFKGDKSRKYSNKGTGLGISISKHLVQLLNCKIKIESEVNIGTKIQILF